MKPIERVAVIGVDHWHAEFHTNILKKEGKQVVGVSSKVEDAANKWGAQLGCAAWTDHRQMVEETQPDFIIGMARHADMPEVYAYMLETGIPILVEKPLGLSAEQVAPLAEAARRRGAFAAVPFLERLSPIWQRIATLRSEGRLGKIAHAHFRVVNGPPSRYIEAGVGWMLDPEISGGGPLRNLGVHCVDAFLYLTGEDVEVVGADLSYELYGNEIEDFATAILRSESGVIGTIEAGYTYASMTSSDFEWRIAAANAYLRDRFAGMQDSSPAELLISTLDEGDERVTLPPEVSRYPEYMVETLRRAENGEPPIATIEDAYQVVKVIDKIYEHALHRRRQA